PSPMPATSSARPMRPADGRGRTEEPAMVRMTTLVVAALLAAGSATGANAQATVFEGARVITGEGGAIENAAFVIENGRFTMVGRRADVTPPAGAARVDLAGKTV